MQAQKVAKNSLFNLPNSHFTVTSPVRGVSSLNLRCLEIPLDIHVAWHYTAKELCQELELVRSTLLKLTTTNQNPLTRCME